MAFDPYNGPEDRYLDSMMEDRLSGLGDRSWYEDFDDYTADDEDRDEDDGEEWE